MSRGLALWTAGRLRLAARALVTMSPACAVNLGAGTEIEGVGRLVNRVVVIGHSGASAGPRL